ncbi:hypothetical protein cyc_05657 [Cyclospora cayetanensis]|uniref:Uncharacterized protein n=1 Tax=Cyclospora cayetanensis TaxID=88456 RepID=A0A1D3D4X0_9EIME|nr:hypothetical protein cyc_05657 [Cyclospora cayetanensis]
MQRLVPPLMPLLSQPLMKEITRPPRSGRMESVVKRRGVSNVNMLRRLRRLSLLSLQQQCAQERFAATARSVQSCKQQQKASLARRLFARTECLRVDEQTAVGCWCRGTTAASAANRRDVLNVAVPLYSK